jgi:hypothetical protein
MAFSRLRGYASVKIAKFVRRGARAPPLMRVIDSTGV